MANQCPVSGCERKARPGELLCGSHWSPLPSEIKREVWSTWRDFTQARTVEGRLAARKPYLDARDAAIEHASRAEAPLL